jgi:hypothetical protein
MIISFLRINIIGFSLDIFPSSVGIGCKGSELFWIEQGKSHLRVIFLV